MRKTSKKSRFINLILFFIAAIVAHSIPAQAQVPTGWVCDPVRGSSASDPSSSACGVGSRVYGIDSVAFGDGNLVESSTSTAFGRNNTLTNTANGSTVLGQDNTMKGQSLAVGKSNDVWSSSTVTMGFGNIVGNANTQQRSSRSVLIGSDNILASQTDTGFSSSVLIGDNGAVYASESIAIGKDNTVGSNVDRGLYTQSLAVGNTNTVWGNRSVAFGSNITIGTSEANGANDSIAIGSSAYVTGNNSTALGSNTQALGENSTAIGTGAVATRDNQISIGTATSTYTASGITSAASKAAQVGATQFVTTDSSGNLASTGYGPQDIANLNNSMTGLSNAVGIIGANVSSLSNRVDGNQREARQGIAMAMAMPNTHFPSAPGKTTVSGSLGNYKGYGAVGAAFMHRLDTTMPVAVGVSTAIGMRNSIGVRGEVVTEF